MRIASKALFHVIQFLRWHEDQIDEIVMWAIILATGVSLLVAFWTGGP